MYRPSEQSLVQLQSHLGRLNERCPSVSGMRRLFVILLVVAACGGDAGDGREEAPAAPASSTTTSVAGTSTSTDTAPTTEGAADATTTTSDRPVAPDFTLELGDGGEYTLSEGEKPVYLVFWAEW